MVVKSKSSALAKSLLSTTKALFCACCFPDVPSSISLSSHLPFFSSSSSPSSSISSSLLLPQPFPAKTFNRFPEAAPSVSGDAPNRTKSIPSFPASFKLLMSSSSYFLSMLSTSNSLLNSVSTTASESPPALSATAVSSGGGAKYGTLPLFQSDNTALAADFLSGMPPFTTFPRRRATAARKACESPGPNLGTSYAIIRLDTSFPTRFNIASTPATGSAIDSVSMQFRRSTCPSPPAGPSSNTTPGLSIRRTLLSNTIVCMDVV
mmetsp:Transcript_33960/g.66949  ORF Transcript_33960/g.66949 Transcript_33960/m.66949 type:complete len:264 (+) Transcript_33960:293-1084(+)